MTDAAPAQPLSGAPGPAYVFDTYAWVEELGGGPMANEVHGIHVPHDIGTSVLSLAELAHVATRRTPEHLERILETVRATSEILPVTAAIAEAAGRTRAALESERKGIGLVDCLTYETARSVGAVLVTGDPHLRGLEGVRFLGE